MGSTSRTVRFALETDLPKPLRRFLNRPRSVTTEAAELYNRLAKEGPVGGLFFSNARPAGVEDLDVQGTDSKRRPFKPKTVLSH